MPTYNAKTGGYLQSIRTSLKYMCPAEHIPPKIEIDGTNLDYGDKMFVSDIEVRPSLKLLSKNEKMPICKISATKLENPEPAVMQAMKCDLGVSFADFMSSIRKRMRSISRINLFVYGASGCALVYLEERIDGQSLNSKEAGLGFPVTFPDGFYI